METGRERPSRQMTAAIERALKLSEKSLIDIYDALS
jgi:hypothetical protein